MGCCFSNDASEKIPISSAAPTTLSSVPAPVTKVIIGRRQSPKFYRRRPRQNRIFKMDKNNHFYFATAKKQITS
jgi:hypothetical protein